MAYELITKVLTFNIYRNLTQIFNTSFKQPFNLQGKNCVDRN